MLRLLNTEAWTLTGFLPTSFAYNLGRGRENNFYSAPLVPEFPVNVPGSIHSALLKQGYIDDPFFETNNLKCEWIEHKEWLYRCNFTVQKAEFKKKHLLVFEGVNNQADYYLNDEFLGTHYNVNTRACFDVTGKLRENNVLCVLIHPVEQEQPQMGRTSQTKHQTERFAFGWDFSTRMIGVGIFKDVKLYSFEKSLLEDVYLRTSVKNGCGILKISGKCKEGMTLSVNLQGFGTAITKEYIVGGRFTRTICVPAVALWYPLNYGEQNLYDLSLTLKNGSLTEDEQSYQIGFKTVEYIREPNSHENSLPYTVQINGKKIWLAGVNVINLSHLLGSVTEEDYEFYIKSCRDMNINMIRLWGGAVLERDIIYRLADQFGILVFQDFQQSSSGSDSYPSADKDYVKELMNSCRETIKNTRNHTSVIIYCGGNELRNADYTIIDPNFPQLVRIRKEVKKLSPHVIFHYTTPSGINFNLQTDEESLREHKNENIHGHYAYLGIDEHYRYYNLGDQNFQCEFGCNGCCDEQTLTEIMSPAVIQEYKEPLTLNWLNRNSGWYNCYPRDTVLFGQENMDHIERYCAASQFIQAEGVRYIIERNRDRAFECSGCAIWQLNEPWPNSNCTTLIDYYKRRKTVFRFVKEAYAPVNANLKYSSLIYKKGTKLDFEIYLSSLADDFTGEICWEIFGLKGAFLKETRNVTAKCGKATLVSKLEQRIDDKFGNVFGVRLTVKRGEKTECENIYLFSTGSEPPFADLFSERISVRARAEKRGGKYVVHVENDGDNVAFFMELYAEGEARPEISEHYFTLFPHETKSIEVDAIPEAGLCLKDFSRSVALKGIR